MCVQSAEDFLSQYSFEVNSKQKSFTLVKSLKSLQRLNNTSIVCTSNEDIGNTRKNSPSSIDLSANSITRPVDPLSVHVMMLMSGGEKPSHDPPNPNNPAIIKKSKFADEY